MVYVIPMGVLTYFYAGEIGVMACDFGVNCRGEEATIPIVDKVDIRPGIQSPLDARAEPPVRQQAFCNIGNQDGISDN